MLCNIQCKLKENNAHTCHIIGMECEFHIHQQIKKYK